MIWLTSHEKRHTLDLIGLLGPDVKKKIKKIFVWSPSIHTAGFTLYYRHTDLVIQLGKIAVTLQLSCGCMKIGHWHSGVRNQ